MGDTRRPSSPDRPGELQKAPGAPGAQAALDWLLQCKASETAADCITRLGLRNKTGSLQVDNGTSQTNQNVSQQGNDTSQAKYNVVDTPMHEDGDASPLDSPQVSTKRHLSKSHCRHLRSAQHRASCEEARLENKTSVHFGKDATSSCERHVVVTGGAGYIGSQAALELLSKGDCVTVVDNLVRGRRSTIEALQKIDGSAERLRFAEVDYVGISLC